MDKIVIQGGERLQGSLQASGAKNACLPILAAAMMGESPSIIHHVPQLKDINTMIEILNFLGVECEWIGPSSLKIDPQNLHENKAPYELVRKMRASVCLLGPLLAKTRRAVVSIPGGCVIGPRPIDLHLKGLRALNVKIQVEHGYVVADGTFMKGADIFLGGRFGSSVLGTANVMMAACLTPGITFIESAACEPEIVDLAEFLKKMGAKIEGAGSHTIKIEGSSQLKGTEHTVIPDRIEVGTYLVAGAMTGGPVKVKNARYRHLSAVIDKLQDAGAEFEFEVDGITVSRKEPLKVVDVITLPYPGFPTDMQAQMMSLMSISEGISVITEKIYSERFMHISELNRLGAKISLEGSSAVVVGRKKLSGAPVMASDLRASAALILAGLVADGETEVHRVYHLDRGYEKIEQKLRALGAKIERVSELQQEEELQIGVEL
ncbi:MAG: UDP-N-acetylglucosamine 1-carboxyvinyltransferase [Chlamydiae bacterium]|nr:UDP-N-acetylglucosamine 1-carboxyvinyltransferase [Chlamydiota bacterium]MBI3277801.1 UDP-N-acetylglucosamine 1-carboxyvinyltransferase [Chlamydiota bacterium]